MDDGVKFFAGIVALVLIVGGMLAWGWPAYNRYQDRQYHENQVTLNEIVIKQQEQLIQVETQKAAIRVAEAKGIAESQRIINSSLTTNYLQYLAIKAQEQMANSPNHTQIYIPSGSNGIPIVKAIDPKE